MVGKLLNQQPRQQTPIGHALLEDRGRRGGTTEDFRLFAFDHRANVFQHDIGPRPLGDAIGPLLPDHRIGLRGETSNFGIREVDFLHRDRGINP
jgi:hypothetical protein